LLVGGGRENCPIFFPPKNLRNARWEVVVTDLNLLLRLAIIPKELHEKVGEVKMSLFSEEISFERL